MTNSCKEFVISEHIKNISRFVAEEYYFTNTEERFNIPWRMRIWKKNGYFEFYLRCEKEECENRKWSIETEFTLKLISCNGKRLTKTDNYTFEKPEERGWSEFIRWKELECDYGVDDSIVVEAHVKIIKITYSPCIENENQKIFLLHHTVKNVSSIKEGGNYFTNTEKRFNIPWRLQIQRFNEFFGLYLRCEKELSNRRNWTIEVEYDLRLVSLNGQSLSIKGTSTFEKPISYGYCKFIRWDDMENKYMVNDSVIIGALVKITKMTGCEEQTSWSWMINSMFA
ncbi:MATH domain-containing protein [Caenorhabditis elegans]|uniref:MATH domain-containing protein n=1 Tax=Caenorhabditis elegans TaxID=6239 RepID=O16558_CAEEL|nr:MATH domain-containing protein [Caenorhabditis elegans]CCD64672.1 MATH domain-containing protein [Caenorhabditis elegans]|eukprot:NP_494108.1 MATH (meprin-associated Traf homology) domain containing [Caenorhabditis elegans]